MTTYDGEHLNLTKVTRYEMGAYLCIASNGVPPTVSKRIIVDVECTCLKYEYNNKLLYIKSFEWPWV